MPPVPADRPAVALLYTRVSSTDQEDEGVSLPAQVSECRRYVARMGWDFGDECQDVQTGRRDDRPDYQRLLATARRLAVERVPAVVVVASLDRLGRSVAERVRAYEELARLGAPIHSVREGGLVSELTYNILAAVAQEESRKLSERVRASIRFFQGQGWHPPGSRAWGYADRPSTDDERRRGAPKTVLVPHEIEAPYVREAWRRYAEGASIRSIARWAADLPSAARGGRNLNYGVIHKLLRTPVYVARIGAADLVSTHDPADVLARPVGQWEPLIDDDTWRRAAERTVMARRIPRQASGHYPLTGLMRCARCGDRMSGRTQPTYGNKTKPFYRQYVCNAGLTLGAATAGRRCAATVNADSLDRAVLDTVADMLKDAAHPDVRRRIERERARQTREEGGQAEGAARRIATLDQQYKRVSEGRAQLTVKFSLGEIERDIYDEAMAHVRREIDAIAEELGRLRSGTRARDAVPMDALRRGVPSWSRAFRSADLAAQRDALATLVERVSPERIGRGQYRPIIAWTPLGRWLRVAAGRDLGTS